MSKMLHTLRRLAAVVVLGATALAIAPAASQAQSTVRVDLSSGPASQSLSLPRGKSAIIELPVDARDVLVSNPAVADAVLRTPRRIYILGVAPGTTDAVFFDAAGRQILSLNIRVDQSTAALEDTIRRIAPTSNVVIEAANDGLILTGSVASAAESASIEKVAARYVEKPEQIVNMLSIRGGQQVMIKVQIVEMQRNIIKQLGVDTNLVLNQLGQNQWLLGNAPTFGINGSFLGGFNGGYSMNSTNQIVTPGSGNCGDLTTTPGDPSNPASCVATGRAGDEGVNQARALIRAFERVGVVRTLAEPNITAVSGESGKFLAGGEFPVPTGRDQNGQITIEFKPYGVGLGYLPVVLSEGRISIKISTEVSELTSEGALQIAGLNIPGLSVRRAETTVEMASGQTLMIAGLLKEQTKETIDGLPGMTGLPVLGALFRSRDYLAGETELVVLITPYLVEGTHPNRMQTPADGLVIASDVETTLLGRINRATNGANAVTPRGPYQAPVGYVID
ncbi:type II and III secretion system protein family protein [Brevundimonas sp.]|uniref:type II and III secretion system protein family protein n=1 Tax=Brevundimonas sp. TaxID=1871086 RepID=UPI002D6AC344|nr:type II and III secretion system protein family protein [Brevundimonas sp.]HYC73906.1 type II and III secretion system protein family protein [Brevundimonas sp.]